MAGDKISDQPEKLTELLKKEQRDYDCTPCRVVGMFYLSIHCLHLTCRELLLTVYHMCDRRHGISRPRWLQLPLRYEPAPETARGHPQEQLVAGHARPETWDLGTLAWIGLDGSVSAVCVMRQPEERVKAN